VVGVARRHAPWLESNRLSGGHPVDARLLLKRASCRVGFAEREEIATSATNSMWSDGCEWCGSLVGAARTAAPEGGRSTAKVRSFTFDRDEACKKM